MAVDGSSFIWIILLFAGVCLWQILVGLAKMRKARSSPTDPNAPLLARMGKIQAFAGGGMLLANIIFNLPVLRALL